ncbi:GNAT family N-acetyltransferase [Candidatus Woesearchaeota archaeon]|nr:GNAT family N-acetyltransferase [Candidatus Woesearchaeota archaeon]
MINLRPAKLSDIKYILEFEHAIGANERKFEPLIKKKGKIQPSNREDFKKYIRSNNWCVIVAEENNTPMGFGAAYVWKLPPKWSYTKNIGYLRMMYVDKKYRGKGVGKSIVKEIIKWFKKKNIKEMRTSVYSKNIPTKKFYERLGFKNIQTTMNVKFKQ